MASLLHKIRTLFKANLHDLADKAVQRNDLAVYDAYIREAEQEVAEFKATIAPMFAQVKRSKRRRDTLAQDAAKLDYAVDQFLMKDQRTEAMMAQRRLTSILELIGTYDTSLERQVAAAETLQDVRIKLEGRLDIARREREELGFLLELAKAKELSAQAMRSLDSLMGEGDAEIAQAAENIRRRLDHADATWEVQTSSLDAQIDAATNSLEVEAQLAARMERLGLD